MRTTWPWWTANTNSILLSRTQNPLFIPIQEDCEVGFKSNCYSMKIAGLCITKNIDANSFFWCYWLPTPFSLQRQASFFYQGSGSLYLYPIRTTVKWRWNPSVNFNETAGNYGDDDEWMGISSVCCYDLQEWWRILSVRWLSRLI